MVIKDPEFIIFICVACCFVLDDFSKVKGIIGCPESFFNDTKPFIKFLFKDFIKLKYFLEFTIFLFLDEMIKAFLSFKNFVQSVFSSRRGRNQIRIAGIIGLLSGFQIKAYICSMTSFQQ